MQFDRSYRPDTSTLPPFARATYDAVRAASRAEHLAVQFIRKDGKRDEWSFPSEAARDAFIARLTTPYAIS